MLEMKYIGSEESYQVEFKNISKNITQLKGDFPIKTVGFTVGRIGDPEAFTGDYSSYTTIYREIEGGVQFSNDGSVYIEPIPIVSFYSNGGGSLDGETVQEVKDYSDLVIPTPVSYENYEFTEWNPEIPLSGEIKGNKSFTAIFTSTLPTPDSEPTIEERVTSLEEDMQALNIALGGISDETGTENT
jgi:hypothetical protein